jgi:large subunit ribosomal protein L17
MRHHVRNRKFGREADQRRAFKRALMCALIEQEKIKTTEARAKEIRPLVEKLVTKALTGTLASKRVVHARLGGVTSVTKKLCNDIAPRYAKRNGGYTRITKLPARPGDASKMALIEFI